MSGLIRIKRGGFRGMTGRVVSVTADDLRVRLTCQARTIRIPREDTWYEDVDDEPMTAQQARERLAS